MCRDNPDHLDDGKALLRNSTDINKHRDEGNQSGPGENQAETERNVQELPFI